MSVRKDPNKPKGKMTAYAFFVQTCRQEHKKAHPDEQVVFAEFSKKCAERWKGTTIKEKKIFNDKACRDKLRYDREMEGYLPPPGAGGDGRRVIKRKKDPNAPKRPQSAFFLFCGDHRGEIKKQHPTFTVGDTAKSLGKMWGEVDPSSKAKYQELAQQAKERYTEVMKAYNDQLKCEASNAKKQKKEESSSSSSATGSESESDQESD